MLRAYFCKIHLLCLNLALVSFSCTNNLKDYPDLNTLSGKKISNWKIEVFNPNKDEELIDFILTRDYKNIVTFSSRFVPDSIHEFYVKLLTPTCSLLKKIEIDYSDKIGQTLFWDEKNRLYVSNFDMHLTRIDLYNSSEVFTFSVWDYNDRSKMPDFKYFSEEIANVPFESDSIWEASWDRFISEKIKHNKEAYRLDNIIICSGATGPVAYRTRNNTAVNKNNHQVKLDDFEIKLVKTEVIGWNLQGRFGSPNQVFHYQLSKGTDILDFTAKVDIGLPSTGYFKIDNTIFINYYDNIFKISYN